MKPTWFHPGWRPLVGPLGLLLALALLAGCGRREGKVSGRVLYNGKPLPGGSLYFRPADGALNTVSVTIDEKGNYEAALPVGEVKIAVNNTELQRQPAEGGGRPQLPPIKLPNIPKSKGSEPPEAPPPDAPQKPAGAYVPIPEKFYNADTSGLTYTVKPGPQTHDIELK